MNAWLGTAGTVTACHFDTYDNLFAQVAGFKYIRLYAPSETPKLYPKMHPRADRANQAKAPNCSQVRVEAPDLKAYPEFAHASYTEIVVGPGDVLFIPKVFISQMHHSPSTRPLIEACE